MKKRYVNTLLLITLLLASLSAPMRAQVGKSCSNPIVLGPNYRETIYAAGSTWYIANTFDLPMAIDFYPTNPNSAAPELELDFSCTPGVYEDSILCSLFCKSNSAYISLPHKETPPKSYDAQGNVRYHVEFGEFYRDMLLRQGIDYNVPVYIKVTYHGAGSLQMEPDPFNNCMDGPKFMHLGDTVNVIAHDVNRHVIVPYVQWQYDSIRYVWTGTTPCTIAIGNSCGFDPTDAEDGSIMDGGVIQPGGQFKVSSALLMQYVSDQVNYPNDAGMYFAKFYSEEPGVMKIEKIPAPPPAGGAIVLKYGTQTPIQRNDTNTLYAMPDSWIKAMQFYTPTDHIFKMYVGATPNFYTTDAVATFQFDRTTDGHVLSLFAEDMNALWLNKVSGDHYLYIRFECSDHTTILPTLWTPSDCMTKAKRIETGEQFDVSAKSNTNYSLFFADWKDGDMTIAWTSTQATCSFFIADTCNIPNTNVPPVFYTDKAPKRGSVNIPMATVNSWEPNVDPDGYLYIRFYSTAKGKITVTTSAPEEEDPACSSEDSTLIVTAWDSYVWRGTAYTESGTHSETVSHPEGCDTTFTLHLTIHTTSYDSYEATGCDSIKYNGKKYTETGVFADTLFDVGGNRTVMTLNFTINHPTSSETTLVECDSLFWNGVWYKESGDYTYTTTNAAGCDSIATLHLTVGHSYNRTLEDVKACDSYVWGDTTIYDSGTYTRRFKTVHGCDSMVTRTITIGHSYLNIVDKITAYDSYTWIDGRTYTSSISGPAWGLSTVDDCDSLITLNLTIRHLEKDTFIRTLCETELPYEWYGKFYHESGIYSSDTIKGKAVSGVYVDTVHMVNLTILPVTMGDTTATACKSFTWYGAPLTASGDYTHKLTNAAGCDSTVTLHLTILQPTMGDTTATACNSFTWYGAPLTASGDYTRQLTNANGCDSTVTLHLTILHPTTGDTTATACNSFTWYGTPLTASGDYTHQLTNAGGCDSTVTLHLTINHPTSGEETKEACVSYLWHGHSYTESGIYQTTLTNAAGCDSTATLHLTINDCAFDYDTVYFCSGLNTEHEEYLGDGLARRYLAYAYESPAEWDYMEGVIVTREHDRMLVDLTRAEQNIRNHYVGDLTPVKSIVWSYRPEGETSYVPLTVSNDPQWVTTGVVALTVRFVCGQMYTGDFATDIMSVGDDQLETGGRKVLENGQIVIIRGGSKYTVLGNKIH